MYSQSERASSGLWFAAIVGYVVHIIISLPFLFFPSGMTDAERAGSFLGAALGALLWPMLIVWIASWWPRNKTQARNVKVFFVATAVFVAVRLVSMFIIAFARHKMGAP